MSQHHTIFKDMSSVLKSILKTLPNRIIQNYSNIHREFLESSHTIVKHTLHIDRNSSMKYETILAKMKQVLSLKTK